MITSIQTRSKAFIRLGAFLLSLGLLPGAAGAQSSPFFAPDAHTRGGSASDFRLESLAHSRLTQLDSAVQVLPPPPADLVARMAMPPTTALADSRDDVPTGAGAPGLVGPETPAEASPILTSRVEMKQRGWTRTLTFLEIGFQIANALDVATTLNCMDSPNCYEVNPLFGKHPSKARVIGSKIAFGGIHYIIVRRWAKSDTKSAKIFSAVTLGTQSGIVAWNLSQKF